MLDALRMVLSDEEKKTAILQMALAIGPPDRARVFDVILAIGAASAIERRKRVRTLQTRALTIP